MKPKEEWQQAEARELEDASEVKKEKPIFTLLISDKLHELVVRYSSWKTVQRTVAWFLKLKAGFMHHESCENRGNCLTGNDLEETTVAIVEMVPASLKPPFTPGAKFPLITLSKLHVSPLLINDFQRKLAYAGQ